MENGNENWITFGELDYFWRESEWRVATRIEYVWFPCTAKKVAKQISMVVAVERYVSPLEPLLEAKTILPL